jgi:mycoredoxin
VTLFTLPYCPDCRDLRRHLTGHSVPFTEIDVVNQRGAVEEMLRLNGGKRSAPTVRIGKDVLVDPDLKTLDAALLAAGLLQTF